ncbi:MAG: ECF transporter S component [Austwickia sp.]|nr:ECF transporter S component [Austwickia sp.]
MSGPRSTSWRVRARDLPGHLSLALLTLIGLAAFGWPFLVSAPVGASHGQDAPWLFAALVGLSGAVVLAEQGSRRLDAKSVAMIGVIAALGGAMRVLSAGVAGLEPMFFVVVLAGRVLGARLAFLTGALSLLTGAFLTGAVGPWAPFQMVATGWVALGAALLPPVRGRAEVWLLAAYGLLAGLLYGLVMNLWFWPFLGASAPDGAGFVTGAPIETNLRHYLAFYLLTSLGWDLPRGLLTAALTVLAGRPLLRTLRRATRRAAFDAPVRFEPAIPSQTPARADAPAPKGAS